MASSDTLIVFTAAHGSPSSTNPATFDQKGQLLVLDFDTTTGETAYFDGIMPQHYAGTTGVTVYVHWAAEATSGTVGWLVAFERIGDGQHDIDTEWGGAANNTVTATTVPGTQGFVDITSTTFTDGADMDSVAVGEAFRLRIVRDVATDTAAADANLVAVEIRET